MAVNWWPDEIVPGDSVKCVRLVLWEDDAGNGIRGPGLDRAYKVCGTRSKGAVMALKLVGFGGWWLASCFEKIVADEGAR